MVVLGDDDTLEALTGDAEHWLRQLPADDLALPSVVYGVARRARARASAGGTGPPGRARVRLPSGRWLLVHGALISRR
jgi:hypothetical protein